MQIYFETNTVYCFSSNCKLHNKAIDQIDFILHRENLTKHEAILKAISMIADNHEPESTQQPFDKLFKVFETNLKKSDKAQQYLRSRNI